MSAPGALLRERYRLGALLGKGGMGEVFAATDLSSGEEVAVKLVAEARRDTVLASRLLREAEAVARLRSDWVPRLLEVGQTDDGEVFLVLERLTGISLAARLGEDPPLTWEEVARIGEDVLRGLVDAHTAGVVHRDLKPSNVFLASRGVEERRRAMILDFGVCKIQGQDRERLTGTGEALGTVAYMAPEQIRGASDVDERADLYTFGVVVYEMLTGILPHDGPTQMAVLASKLERAPAPLSSLARGDVPEGLDALVARALAREPSDRFGSAQELLRAWRALDPTISVRSAAPPAVMVKAASPARRSADDADATGMLTAGLARAHGRALYLALAIAGLALASGAVAIGLVVARDPAPAPAVAPSETEHVPSFAPSPPPVEVAPAPPPPSAPPAASSAPRRRAPATATPSGPRITGEPRY